MKRFLFFMAVLLTGGQAVAQEVEETKTLSEVTIHGARIVQRVDGQTIYPTQQQVASSTNGYSLLEKLTLPRVRVDPIMHTITALSNDGNVQVRINDVLAKREDLLALEVEAVERIDYIENPGLRYGEDVACVINIIIKKPSSGYVLGADLTNTLTTEMKRSMEDSIIEKVNSEPLIRSITTVLLVCVMMSEQPTKWSRVLWHLLIAIK